MLMMAMETLERNEDRMLLQEIFLRYEAKMRRVAMRYLQNPRDAEDAVGDAFLKIAEHLEKFKEIPCQERWFWIVSIVRNLSLTKHKRDGLINLAAVEDTIGPESTEGTVGYRYLVRCIRALPETYRCVLELRFIWEWSNVEIAQELNLSLATVDQRVSRGRKILREQLRKEGYYHDGT